MKDFRAALKGACSVLVIVACGSVVPVSFADAQDVSSLTSRLEHIERDLMVLQRQVYRAKVQGGDVSSPVSSGAGSSVAKLGEIEEQMRDLTGQIETLSFQIQQNKTQMERMQADIDFRLQVLEGKNPTAPAGQGQPVGQPGQTLTPPTAAQPVIKPVLPPQGAIPAQPSKDKIILTPPSGAAAAPSVDVPPQEAYNAAFKLVQKGEYAKAEAAFQDFLNKHKDNALAGNAQYWLGETYYVRGQYEKAAVTFADGYKSYRKSPKAADNLFKLGRSMQKLKKVPNACAAFGQLLKEFPKANKVTLQLAKTQRADLKCQ